MPLTLSPEARRDPTSALTIINRYEPHALTLVRSYLRAVEEALRQREFANVNVSAMSFNQFLRYMDRLAKESLDKISWSDEMSAAAYSQGRTFSAIVLGAPPEVRAKIWRKTSVLVERSRSSFVKMTDDMSGNVKRILADGILKERSQGEIIKEIRALSDASEASARRIVRTETMEAVNTGVMDGYRADDVEKVEWLAAEGCCDECQALDGKFFDIDGGVSAPLHPNCRCTLIPVIDLPGEPPHEVTPWEE